MEDVMCCFFIALMTLGPRFALLIYWLIPYGRVQVALAFNTWFWPLLGLIFLPWTTLMYVLVYGANGIVGFDWVWVGLALVGDIAAYSGSAYKRKEIPYYPTTAP
jgi:hypothetical protein